MLEKFLKKVGVKSYLDLNQEEKETYKLWEQALNGKKLTDEDVASFLKNEIEETIKKLTLRKLNESEDTFLKMKLQFIRAIQTFLDSPKFEKEMTEKSIAQLIEKI